MCALLTSTFVSLSLSSLSLLLSLSLSLSLCVFAINVADFWGPMPCMIWIALILEMVQSINNPDHWTDFAVLAGEEVGEAQESLLHRKARLTFSFLPQFYSFSMAPSRFGKSATQVMPLPR